MGRPFPPAAPGRYYLSMMDLAARTAVALSMALAAQAAAQAPARVGGVVLDGENRRPVAGVRVAVLGMSESATTDSAGRFELVRVTAGVRVLQARAIGYLVGSWLVDVSEGQTFRGTFELEPSAVAVEGVTVTADAATNWRSEAAFERRRADGNGVFIGREDIRRRRPATIADLMRGVPGLITTCTSRGCTILMGRSTRQCRPEYFLDGHPATFATGANFPINVTGIRGVEVYRSEFEVPSEFQKINLRCGIIAIWSIEPGEDLDRPER